MIASRSWDIDKGLLRRQAEATRLLMAMNEAGKQPAMNLSLARVYLRHSDPMVSVRTWQNVLDEIIGIKTGPTQARWKSAAKDKAFELELIRNRTLIETPGEHLLAVLRTGTVSTNAFLRKIHNFALDMNWLPATVIPRRQWAATRLEPLIVCDLRPVEMPHCHWRGETDARFSTPVAFLLPPGEL